MQEILTPVQYEPALDVLNQINKLTVSHRVRLSLDAMQACKNPVGTGNPIISKFCKQDNHGSLCCQSDETFTGVEEQSIFNSDRVSQYDTIHFTNRIHGVLVFSGLYVPPSDFLYWTIPNGPPVYKLTIETLEYLPFVGNEITFWLSRLRRYIVYCWGLYL